MGRYVRVLAAALALSMTAWLIEPTTGVLSCEGSFGEFANGFLVNKPSQLRFIVDWLTPMVQTEGGRPAQIIELTRTVLSFAVRYDGYEAIYHVNRIDGAISQIPSLGGQFTGVCHFKSLDTKF
ncbi:MAG TPA: hypothetical protein VMB84_06605 [Stellaceae bacterium]|nr:hypothetical protein [Stellaceae bacterium]